MLMEDARQTRPRCQSSQGHAVQLFSNPSGRQLIREHPEWTVEQYAQAICCSKATTVTAIPLLARALKARKGDRYPAAPRATKMAAGDLEAENE